MKESCGDLLSLPVTGEAGVGVPEGFPGGGRHHLSPHDGGGDVEPLHHHHQHQQRDVREPGARHCGLLEAQSLL